MGQAQAAAEVGLADFKEVAKLEYALHAMRMHIDADPGQGLGQSLGLGARVLALLSAHAGPLLGAANLASRRACLRPSQEFEEMLRPDPARLLSAGGTVLLVDDVEGRVGKRLEGWSGGRYRLLRWCRFSLSASSTDIAEVRPLPAATAAPPAAAAQAAAALFGGTHKKKQKLTQEQRRVLYGKPKGANNPANGPASAAGPTAAGSAGPAATAGGTPDGDDAHDLPAATVDQIGTPWPVEVPLDGCTDESSAGSNGKEDKKGKKGKKGKKRKREEAAASADGTGGCVAGCLHVPVGADALRMAACAAAGRLREGAPLWLYGQQWK